MSDGSEAHSIPTLTVSLTLRHGCKSSGWRRSSRGNDVVDHLSAIPGLRWRMQWQTPSRILLHIASTPTHTRFASQGRLMIGLETPPNLRPVHPRIPSLRSSAFPPASCFHACVMPLGVSLTPSFQMTFKLLCHHLCISPSVFSFEIHSQMSNTVYWAPQKSISEPFRDRIIIGLLRHQGLGIVSSREDLHIGINKVGV